MSFAKDWLKLCECIENFRSKVMTQDNLPPGVTDSMIPGNRPEDEAWEQLHEGIGEDATEHNMTSMDVMLAWKIGLKAYQEAREYGCKFPHDS